VPCDLALPAQLVPIGVLGLAFEQVLALYIGGSEALKTLTSLMLIPRLPKANFMQMSFFTSSLKLLDEGDSNDSIVEEYKKGAKADEEGVGGYGESNGILETKRVQSTVLDGDVVLEREDLETSSGDSSKVKEGREEEQSGVEGECSLPVISTHKPEKASMVCSCLSRRSLSSIIAACVKMLRFFRAGLDFNRLTCSDSSTFFLIGDPTILDSFLFRFFSPPPTPPKMFPLLSLKSTRGFIPVAFSVSTLAKEDDNNDEGTNSVLSKQSEDNDETTSFFF